MDPNDTKKNDNVQDRASKKNRPAVVTVVEEGEPVHDPENPASKPYGSTNDQVTTMESEGQAQQPGQEPPSDADEKLGQRGKRERHAVGLQGDLDGGRVQFEDGDKESLTGMPTSGDPDYEAVKRQIDQANNPDRRPAKK